jgi:hypothetical protein
LPVIASLLVAMYLFSGVVKLVAPQERPAAFPTGGWVNTGSADTALAIGEWPSSVRRATTSFIKASRPVHRIVHQTL